MKTNILVLITLFFTLSFSTKSHAAFFESSPHCLETQGNYITKIVFTVNSSVPYNGSAFTLDFLLSNTTLAANLPVTWNQQGYPTQNITFDVSSYNILYTDECYDYKLFFANGNLASNSAIHADAESFCKLKCELEVLPCNANFKILTNSMGNGTSSVAIQLIDPNVGITYMEVFQNGVLISSGPAQSFVLPSGSYRICIVALNNKTGEECKSCQDFCLGEGKTDFEWNGAKRAEEWQKKSAESIINITPEEAELKKLDKDVKLTITPNPSNGTFLISSLNTEIEMTTVEVFDMNSKLIHSLNSVQNQKDIRVDLRNQQSGIYVVKITYSDGSVSQQKIVIQN